MIILDRAGSIGCEDLCKKYTLDPHSASRKTVSLMVPTNTLFLMESLKKLLYSCTISLIIEDKQMAAERLTGWSGE